jgi:putative mRNA 3-end processing factor
MGDFETSKGFQDIYMSEPTLCLLRAEYNADLDVRDNILPVDLEKCITLPNGNAKLTLLSSGHMLGAVQVEVETADGLRLGYSGDFQWPLERTISVDALVIDGTYGSPDSVREYSQEEAEERLLELMVRKLRAGPIHIRAHRGTIQRALQLLSGNIDTPIIGSDALCKEVSVYQRFGCAAGSLIALKSPDAKAAIATKKYVRLYRTKGDGFPNQPDGSTIVLSGFLAHKRDPVTEYSERAYSVALSNHADFWGTLEYVRATGAKYVMTDNARMNAVRLALELRERLGIEAEASSNTLRHGWGV